MPTTTYWTANGQTTAQVDTFTVTAVTAAGQTLTVSCNGKSITYTTVASDTNATAASGLQALLAASTGVPPELAEATWTVASNVVTATAGTPGTPFTFTSSATGAAITQAHATANASPSDVNAPANWLRSGVAAIPVNGDDVIVADSSVPLLWNLSSLSAVQFNSFTRWQSFTGTIGLPENNPNGYYEYRATYFQFTGPPAGTLSIVLGQGTTGGGPSRERYNVGAQLTNLTVLASGSAADDYAVRFLGTNTSNTISVVNTSLGVAMLPTEAAAFSSLTADGGASIALGAGVSTATAVTLRGASGTILCAPTTLSLDQGATATVQGVSLTYPTVTAKSGSALTWLSNSTITTLTLANASILDKSGDVRSMTITSSTIDGDCQIIDPNSTIAFTNATTLNTAVTSGIITCAAGRTVKFT